MENTTQPTTETKFDNKIINEVIYNDVVYPFSVGVWANKQIETELGIEINQLAAKQNIQSVIARLKYGIVQGLKNQKKTDLIPSITDDFCTEILDAQPGLFGHVIRTYSEAITKYYNIVEVGN